MFNAEQFLEMQVTEANDTQVTPVPAGEYNAIVEKVEVKPWAKRDDPSVSGLKLLLQWSIDDAAVKELLGRDKVTVKQDIMLDITDSGSLDMSKGHNVGLGRLREATGCNTPGQAFAFTMLHGKLAKVSVSHRIHEGNIYAEVKAVAKV